MNDPGGGSPPPEEKLFKPPAPTSRHRCIVCGGELKTHELPAKGLPGLCDNCAKQHSAV